MSQLIVVYRPNPESWHLSPAQRTFVENVDRTQQLLILQLSSPDQKRNLLQTLVQRGRFYCSRTSGSYLSLLWAVSTTAQKTLRAVTHVLTEVAPVKVRDVKCD
jgi:hypothetical protein